MQQNATAARSFFIHSFDNNCDSLPSNRNKNLATEQQGSHTDPKHGIPAILQQQHEVRVHPSDLPVERQDFAQNRVANIHDDRVHPTPNERAAGPPVPDVHQQIAEGQQERGHGCRHEDKGQRPVTVKGGIKQLKCENDQSWR